MSKLAKRQRARPSHDTFLKAAHAQAELVGKTVKVFGDVVEHGDIVERVIWRGEVKKIFPNGDLQVYVGGLGPNGTGHRTLRINTRKNRIEVV